MSKTIRRDTEKTSITLIDLKNGMVVEFRNGLRYMVLNNYLINENGYIYIYDIKQNLKHTSGNEAWIIDKVYRPVYCRSINTIFKEKNLELIWNRKPFYKEDSKYDCCYKREEQMIFKEEENIKIFKQVQIKFDSWYIAKKILNLFDETVIEGILMALCDSEQINKNEMQNFKKELEKEDE